MKYIIEGMRRKQPEQGGTQGYADDDLAHRRRLPATPGKYAAAAAREHDDGQFEQGVVQQKLGTGGIQTRSFRR
jgi:hypothetical protein